ncbi:major facilitator superfamily multidrug resistance transporter HlyD/EmrA/FusE [Neokomagataea thailandica NBRC 106555]|uniref:HlyD family secretion protein n=2 Tax=Neokomagataea TaxID=1223423 RepID=A0A4Y6V9G3_9PROT|nr:MULTISPECIES: HlyD family secretion protein [Neokomagataea]QDH25994.1 HlyD family secretion protein [Neokomagataea tanensis]GBR51264.1 major facilitator superfamily multidrug resistance transporter HlyD/EmrA/FusE [Neokomagataea thailandica NBRC 106555]
MHRLRHITGIVLTLLVVLAAIALGRVMWEIYELSAWTRDGRVRVYVVNAAPEISGTVVSVPVVDNQFVHRGDPLFTLDPLRFRLDINSAQAELAQEKAELALKEADARRRHGLGGLVSAEEEEDFNARVNVEKARVDAAQAKLDTALLNLQRSTVYASVDGYVTNLNLRVGNYAHAGQSGMAIIDAHSYWINGYFEETKLHGVHVGDTALIKLMGYKQLASAHVVSIGRGINDENGVSDHLGLPDVNPIFTWVRLAQRIPVRLEFDKVPEGVTLVAGMTGTITIGNSPHGMHGRLTTWLQNHL